MSWLGVGIGALLGGGAAVAAQKALKVSIDPATTVVASIVGGLVGGAITASAAAADTGPTLHTVDLGAGNQTLNVKSGDVVDLTSATSTVTAIDAHGSDAVSVASTSPATVNVLKPKGALLTVALADGETAAITLVIS